MWNELKNKRVLLSGATGLIGQTLTKKLLQSGAFVLAAVRDRERAEQMLGKRGIRYLESDITRVPLNDMNLDYIIHAASETSSRAFVDRPVEVIATALDGTTRMLKLAMLNRVKGFVYLSSMEVYGAPCDDRPITEEQASNLNTMLVRSCYPESKRMCENLCASYAAEYEVPAKVIRLTQTFGPGVRYEDGRVFAEFARCAIEGRDIVLHTRGETRRNYLYTEDAAEAILTVLVRGKAGEAYNAANEESYCSIREMAELVANCYATVPIHVRVEENPDAASRYVPTLHMNLSAEKLRSLGWVPKVGLQEAYERMIEDMKKNIRQPG